MAGWVLLLLLVQAQNAAAGRVMLLCFSTLHHSTVYSVQPPTVTAPAGLDVACRRAKIWIDGQPDGQNSPSASETYRQTENGSPFAAATCCVPGYLNQGGASRRDTGTSPRTAGEGSEQGQVGSGQARPGRVRFFFLALAACLRPSLATST